MQCVSVSSEISACDGRVRKDLSGAVCHVTSAELHTDLDKVEGWISGMVRTRNIYSLASKGWTTSPCLQRCLVVRSAGRRNNRSIKRCRMKLRPWWTHWELCHMCYTFSWKQVTFELVRLSTPSFIPNRNLLGHVFCFSFCLCPLPWPIHVLFYTETWCKILPCSNRYQSRCPLKCYDIP